MSIRQDRHLARWRAGVFFTLFLLLPSVTAKTRWSSLHLVPDADFLSCGQFVIDAEGYFFNDSMRQKAVVKPTVLLDAGIFDWVNLEIGYAGGITAGLKVRLLGENGPYAPSLAIGAHNILNNKEVNYFSGKDSAMGNEFYLAIGKSIEPLKMRLHFGIQTIPGDSTELFNPYIAIEEYFGTGLYASLEVARRKKAFWPSLFGSLRIFQRKLEISAGMVALNRMLFDENNKFSFSLTSSDSGGFVRPGLWFSLRFCSDLGFGKNDAFLSKNEKAGRRKTTMDDLKKEIDTLKAAIADNQRKMAQFDNSISSLTDSVLSDKNRMRTIVFEKIILLKSMYESEPFDPEQVKRAINQIVLLKDKALPSLKEFVADKKQDRHIRLLSVSLIGEIGGTDASDILLDVLSQSEDPDIKIEILIALGKMKETRAVYVMEQLANDPTDVVAFTAQEVLQKLAREKGIKLSSELKMRPVAMAESTTIKEEKIPVSAAKKAPKTPSASPQKNTAADSIIMANSVSGAATGTKPPAAPVQAVDSVKGTSDKKSPAADSLKAKTQTAATANAADDVWGVQASDSLKTAAEKNALSQPLATDTAASRPSAPVDATAKAKTAGDKIKDAKAADTHNIKNEQPATKTKEKSSQPAPVEKKNR